MPSAPVINGTPPFSYECWTLKGNSCAFLSHRELDQRAGRKYDKSQGDGIALKPHWLRAGGPAGALYRSTSSDHKG